MFVFESLKWSHPSVSGQQTFFVKTALSEVVNPPALFFGLSPRSLSDICLWIFIVSISVYLYLCWHTSCAGSRWIVCVLFCFCTHLPRVCLCLHTFAKSLFVFAHICQELTRDQSEVVVSGPIWWFWAAFMVSQSLGCGSPPTLIPAVQTWGAIFCVWCFLVLWWSSGGQGGRGLPQGVISSSGGHLPQNSQEF